MNSHIWQVIFPYILMIAGPYPNEGEIWAMSMGRVGSSWIRHQTIARVNVGWKVTSPPIPMFPLLVSAVSIRNCFYILTISCRSDPIVSYYIPIVSRWKLALNKDIAKITVVHVSWLQNMLLTSFHTKQMPTYIFYTYPMYGSRGQ